MELLWPQLSLREAFEMLAETRRERAIEKMRSECVTPRDDGTVRFVLGETHTIGSPDEIDKFIGMILDDEVIDSLLEGRNGDVPR